MMMKDDSVGVGADAGAGDGCCFVDGDDGF